MTAVSVDVEVLYLTLFNMAYFHPTVSESIRSHVTTDYSAPLLKPLDVPGMKFNRKFVRPSKFTETMVFFNSISIN